MSALAPVLAATDVMVAQNVAFAVIAAGMLFSAVRVVTTKNVVHAALHLVVVLGGVAAQYILLAAEFVAVTQVLVYIGAIVVLFLFGIMLTQARMGRSEDLDNKPMQPYALGVAGLLAALLGFVLWDGFRDTELPLAGATTGGLDQTTDRVSDAIFGTHLVPFEAVSVLLLAALIGAIVLARRD